MQIYPSWLLIKSNGSNMSLITRAVGLSHDNLGELGNPDALRKIHLRKTAILTRLARLPCAQTVGIYALFAIRWALEDDLNAEGLSLNVLGTTI